MSDVKSVSIVCASITFGVGGTEGLGGGGGGGDESFPTGD